MDVSELLLGQLILLAVVRDLRTVTFYLSWRHISVVQAVKLDLADRSARASLIILMIG